VRVRAARSSCVSQRIASPRTMRFHAIRHHMHGSSACHTTALVREYDRSRERLCAGGVAERACGGALADGAVSGGSGGQKASSARRERGPTSLPSDLGNFLRHLFVYVCVPPLRRRPSLRSVDACDAAPRYARADDIPCVRQRRPRCK
jgi:hypothetical protein